MSMRGLLIARPGGPRVPLVLKLVFEVEDIALPGLRGGTREASGASSSDSDSDVSVSTGLFAGFEGCEGLENVEESLTCRLVCFNAASGSIKILG